MLQHYEDILSRIAEPPRWFDEQGVPRYWDFAPLRVANIYARECALLAIECQNCGRPFIVALDERTANNNVITRPGYEPPWRTLADIIRSHEIGTGTRPMSNATPSERPSRAQPAACSNTGSVFRRPIPTLAQACS